MSMPSADIELMPCTADDVNKLNAASAATFIETFIEYYGVEGFNVFLRKAYAPGVLAGEVANPGSAFCFTQVDGGITGYARINVDEAQSKDTIPDALETGRIYVLKRFKGCGLGRLVLERTFKEARVRGAEPVRLGTWEHNDAVLRFYKHLGFKMSGSHTFCIDKTRDTDLFMRRKIGPRD